MSDFWYDLLKDVALYILPALIILIVALCEIWGFAHTSEVQLTLASVETFLGAMVKWLNVKYNKSNEESEDE